MNCAVGALGQIRAMGASMSSVGATFSDGIAAARTLVHDAISQSEGLTAIAHDAAAGIGSQRRLAADLAVSPMPTAVTHIKNALTVDLPLRAVDDARTAIDEIISGSHTIMQLDDDAVARGTADLRRAEFHLDQAVLDATDPMPGDLMRPSHLAENAYADELAQRADIQTPRAAAALKGEIVAGPPASNWAEAMQHISQLDATAGGQKIYVGTIPHDTDPALDRAVQFVPTSPPHVVRAQYDEGVVRRAFSDTLKNHEGVAIYDDAAGARLVRGTFEFDEFATARPAATGAPPDLIAVMIKTELGNVKIARYR